ncbi:MAG: hypothetical protein OEY88_02470 [Candidatus Bathyarchaeota archaeon]|nr:hypothetical protein [Candidatus Bathyarchaeota archaeon]
MLFSCARAINEKITVRISAYLTDATQINVADYIGNSRTDLDPTFVSMDFDFKPKRDEDISEWFH